MRAADAALAVLATLLLAGCAHTPPPKHIAAARTVGVVWFSGDKDHGLWSDGSGNLMVDEGKITLPGRVADLFAAAYYPDAGAALTVDGEAAVRLYETHRGKLRLTETWSPQRPTLQDPRPIAGPSHASSARFSRLPGLVYLAWYYQFQDERRRDSQTMRMRRQPQRASVYIRGDRVTLGAGAQHWHAALGPCKQDQEAAQYVFQTPTPTTVDLRAPDGRRIVLRLSDPLVTPMGTQTRPDREAVFVLPGHGIIGQTSRGWTLYDMDGRLLHSVAYPAYVGAPRTPSDWQVPFYRDGKLYVCYVLKGVRYHRLDFAGGEAVPVRDLKVTAMEQRSAKRTGLHRQEWLRRAQESLGRRAR